MADAAVIEGGFADLVFDGQRVFRATMDALANPGTIRALGATAEPPAPLTPELAALALTLCDHDSPVWLDAGLAAAPVVANWLRFHTGAPIVADPAEAMFALVVDVGAMPRLESFAMGTDEYPDRSTTIIAAVDGLKGGAPFALQGPGIEHTISFAPHLQSADFYAQWTDNRAKFPRGVDLLFVAAGAVVGLPRTTRIGEA
ncbi:MAG: phosphonate C-P lyase system protein PhnH [Devosia sp.]|nr:phosphonate C-P lyase system protein PhnH [Devosia sp.]